MSRVVVNLAELLHACLHNAGAPTRTAKPRRAATRIFVEVGCWFTAALKACLQDYAIIFFYRAVIVEGYKKAIAIMIRTGLLNSDPGCRRCPEGVGTEIGTPNTEPEEQ